MDSLGVCLLILFMVHFTEANTGSDTAFVEVQVNVTQTGAYNIVSDQQDGFIFQIQASSAIQVSTQ
jgi:hypothetical protein